MRKRNLGENERVSDFHSASARAPCASAKLRVQRSPTIIVVTTYKRAYETSARRVRANEAAASGDGGDGGGGDVRGATRLERRCVIDARRRRIRQSPFTSNVRLRAHRCCRRRCCCFFCRSCRLLFSYFSAVAQPTKLINNEPPIGDVKQTSGAPFSPSIKMLCSVARPCC